MKTHRVSHSSCGQRDMILQGMAVTQLPGCQSLGSGKVCDLPDAAGDCSGVSGLNGLVVMHDSKAKKVRMSLSEGTLLLPYLSAEPNHRNFMILIWGGLGAMWEGGWLLRGCNTAATPSLLRLAAAILHCS